MKKYHKLETYDWRDNRHFFGTSEEFEDYERTGCYLLDDHSLGTRYHDGYQASDATLIAGPKDGWYSESGAFITVCPDERDTKRLHRYEAFPLGGKDERRKVQLQEVGKAAATFRPYKNGCASEGKGSMDKKIPADTMGNDEGE